MVHALLPSGLERSTAASIDALEALRFWPFACAARHLLFCSQHRQQTHRYRILPVLLDTSAIRLTYSCRLLLEDKTASMLSSALLLFF